MIRFNSFALPQGLKLVKNKFLSTLVRVSKDSALNRLAEQAATDLMHKRNRNAKWKKTN